MQPHVNPGLVFQPKDVLVAIHGKLWSDFHFPVILHRHIKTIMNRHRRQPLLIKEEEFCLFHMASQCTVDPSSRLTDAGIDRISPMISTAVEMRSAKNSFRQ
jgi:hypothetical protein